MQVIPYVERILDEDLRARAAERAVRGDQVVGDGLAVVEPGVNHTHRRGAPGSPSFTMVYWNSG